jgi:putative tryptophan/tyrosine transport system substrate-binding protein
MVASFARPGGNVTGFTNVEPELGGKMLAMLTEVAPSTIRVAPIYHPEIGPSTELFMPSITQAAALHRVKVISAAVRSPSEIESVLTALGQQPGGGVIVMLDTFVTAHLALIMSLIDRYNLPAIWPVPFFAKEGALIGFGADIVDLYRRAAPYVDRILKGAKPADLPVQAPTKFELVINLKTAKALGLTFPLSLLVRADEVIE